ncbi:hypothetical protein A5725_23405 [Mycobacterium kubicae]|uniref:DUF3097 domain-containing protein n=1 Tax=Mycobacterium kubicae TaxID=120959 RepID=UPI0007FCF633|nr:DUF3097 domain-containing protein [Mycobacterium kubicae]OBF17331.1 hypothetical protein A5725_23405 [Mycobacterium kubicae]
MVDRYGTDVLAGGGRRKPRSVEHPVEIGMVVEDAQTGYVGAVVRVEYGRIDLEDRHGKTRGFPLGPGFLLEGRPVILTPPRRSAPAAATRTASGSVAVPNVRARVARASRIYVEGRHDAELIAQVWGEDLRVEGVVVEHLGGVDDLVDIVEKFAPSPTSRLGVLVDHLVPGSKEARIAAALAQGPGGADTLVVGHPYVDIWQAVKPARLGLAAWPVVPRHIQWKHGVCDALGWPHANQADIAAAWRRIRAQVRDWNDLEPALIGRVEELIDFVTQPAA